MVSKLNDSCVPKIKSNAARNISFIAAFTLFYFTCADGIKDMHAAMICYYDCQI